MNDARRHHGAGMLQMEYPDGDIYEQWVAGSRHHEARCRWCEYRTGWLVQTYEAQKTLTDHLVAAH